MTKAKHTPGPWTSDESATVMDSIGRCMIFNPGPTTNNSERIANARLIAAAPDLLGSLQALKLVCLADPLNPCWDNRSDDVPGLHWGSSANETFPACTSCNARAAIAKATGAA